MNSPQMHLGKHVSTRRSALRAGDRAGMIYGITARHVGQKMTRDRARKLAALAAAGRSYGLHPVPQRWRPLFERAFIRAATFAAQTDRDISASSKYGFG